jgi:rare lipoprotein A
LRVANLNSVSYHPKKRMTLKRTNFLTSGFLFLSFYLLLACGLALPASASTHRSHKALAPATTLTYTTVLRGRASWYGREHQGMRTSSGERFNRFKYTCAHKSLPFGTRLRVTNLKTGKAVVVRVSDRGPFRHQRILDLAEAAARPLGIVQQGAATVIAQLVPATTPLGPTAGPANLPALQAADPNPAAAFTTYELSGRADSTAALAATPTTTPDSARQALSAGPVLAAAPAATHFVVQAGTFADVQHAQAMRARLLALDPALAVELTEEITNGQSFTRVTINQLANWMAAETVRRRLQSWGVMSLVRQLPNQPALAVSTASVAAAPLR